MSLPSCFALLNLGTFENLVSQIGEMQTEAELQALANQIMAQISLLESTITSQLAFLGPWEVLLTAPSANLGAIVTYINNLITALTQTLKPYIILAEQLAALPAEVAAITAALEAAASRLNITITIPVPSIGCTL